MGHTVYRVCSTQEGLLATIIVILKTIELTYQFKEEKFAMFSTVKKYVIRTCFKWPPFSITAAKFKTSYGKPIFYIFNSIL